MIAKRGKRNESSLIAFDKVIREARNQNLPVSYAKICNYLLEQHNLKVAPSTVFNYVKVRSKPRTYFKLLPEQPTVVPVETKPDQDAVRQAQLEEKKRVDQSRSENEAYLKAKEANEKKTFPFDPAKPMELKSKQS